MIRRAALGGLLIVGALLVLIAASNWTSEICVITRPNDYAPGKMGLWEEHQLKVLRTLGIRFDTYDLGVPTEAVMESLQVGSVPNGIFGAWRRYKGLIWLGSVNGTTFAGGPAYSMDFFSQIGTGSTRMPPLVPMLWLPAAHTSSSFDGGASCSTGVTAQAVDLNKDSTHVAYVPGLGYAWRVVRATAHLRRTTNYATYCQHVRPLVAYTAARFTERPVPENQDSYNDAGYAADSLIAWEVDFTLANGAAIYQRPHKQATGPILKVQPNIYCFAGGPTDGTMMTMLPCLARLDTLTSGAVFRGATGKKVAIGIQAAANLATDVWGSFVSDTVAYYPASLRLMDGLGVPYTLQISTTGDTLLRAVRWFSRLQMARFTPGGGEQVSPGKVPGNASLDTYIADYLGRSRTRWFWSGGTTDTSIANLLKADLALVRGKFGRSRTDAVLTFPRWAMDFKPGLAGPSADSAKAALAYAGYGGLVFWWRQPVASSINETGGGGTQIAAARQWVHTHPSVDFGAGPTRLRVLCAGSSSFEYNGRLIFNIDAGNFDQPSNILSDDGNDGGIRKYLPDAGLDLWMIEAGWFGTGHTTGTPYYRWGYYQFKWLVSVIRATDAMCWRGNRCPLRVVSLSELAGSNP